jgi:pyruvate/2-oxoglutarate dehydrogenase complex dihydrolipoamide dehydrogenase (E3) component
MLEQKNAEILILGGGTAATNAARAAKRAGAGHVVLVHTPELINTCVEEGCMPSKSILAGGHSGEQLEEIESTRDAHIIRLRHALTEGLASQDLTVEVGFARFTGPQTVAVSGDNGHLEYTADKIIIATGSVPFVPPITGLDTAHPRILLSDEVVGEGASFPESPQSVLVVGAGPIGLELATFFHDIGASVSVLQRTGRVLPHMDEEFGTERHRASLDPASFPIELHAALTGVTLYEDRVLCQIDVNGVTQEHDYEYVLIATGRQPRVAELDLPAAGVECDERGRIAHDATMRTNHSHIFVAGDVTGHHQILHYAAKMGELAGTNAAAESVTQIDYDRYMLAVSFDQYPSATIGLTEAVAMERGVEVVTATRCFDSIGLGILKRQEYGMWKLIAEASTGRVRGAQVLGPAESGELVQLLVPILSNQNTVADILEMTWYHPTYAEILHSLARDICQHETIVCPGQ